MQVNVGNFKKTCNIHLWVILKFLKGFLYEVLGLEQTVSFALAIG
jgi:hypothetical protein